MKRYWIKSIVAMAAIVGLSACAVKGERPSAGDAQDPPSAGDVVNLPLFINGKPLDEILRDPDATNEILAALLGKKFYGEEGREELRKLVAAFDNGADDEPAFRGLSGFSTLEFVRAVLDPKVKRKPKGLIGDYLVEFDRETNRGEGHLTVDVKTKIFFTDRSMARDVPDRVERLQWHIEVVKEGFEVRFRGTDVNNPFPNTVIFPDFATDPSDPRSIWYRGLDHKLWAKGTRIVVRDIFQQIDDGPIERLPNSHPFYTSTKESCIDMMTRGYPPSFRIDFPEQSGYCLGRCDHPYIMNSM